MLVILVYLNRCFSNDKISVKCANMYYSPAGENTDRFERERVFTLCHLCGSNYM